MVHIAYVMLLRRSPDSEESRQKNATQSDVIQKFAFPDNVDNDRVDFAVVQVVVVLKQFDLFRTVLKRIEINYPTKFFFINWFLSLRNYFERRFHCFDAGVTEGQDVSCDFTAFLIGWRNRWAAGCFHCFIAGENINFLFDLRHFLVQTESFKLILTWPIEGKSLL